MTTMARTEDRVYKAARLALSEAMLGNLEAADTAARTFGALAARAGWTWGQLTGRLWDSLASEPWLVRHVVTTGAQEGWHAHE